MKGTTILAAALLTLQLAACGDDDDEAEIDTSPMTAAELCALHAVYTVNAPDGMDAYQGIHPMCRQANAAEKDDFSDAALSAACRPGTTSYEFGEMVMEAIEAGRLEIDWGKARQCMNKARELRESNPGYKLITGQVPEWDELEEGDCKAFHKGLVTQGGECVHDWDCQGDLGCFTDDPTTVGSRQCLPPLGLDEPCNVSYHDCAEGLTCGEQDVCVAAGDELSGFNGSCAEATDCAGPCAMCKNGTCMPLGGEGEACADWLECVDDLGCTGGVCARVAAGEPCGPQVEGVCEIGLACAHPCAQYADAESCTSAGCTVDEQNEVCMPPAGESFTCKEPPTSGPCLDGYVCGEGTYCDANTTCVAYAAAGATCSESGAQCDESIGLSCIEGRCALACECGDGEYCDDDGICQPLSPSDCTSSSECPDGQYCPSCNIAVDADECDAKAGCSWGPIDGDCAPSCWGHDFADDPQAACEAANCYWDSQNGCFEPCMQHEDETSCTGDVTGTCAWVNEECVYATDCGQYTAQGACNEDTECYYYVYDSACLPDAGVTFACLDQGDVGAACTDNVMCESGTCLQTGTGETLCAYEARDGCNPVDGTLLTSVFMLGSVVFVIRRRRIRR